MVLLLLGSEPAQFIHQRHVTRLMGVCVHAHVCVCVFWFPIHELWLSVDDWEMERDRERRAVLVGRLLNSSFCSLNWICCGDTGRQEKRRNIYQFIRILPAGHQQKHQNLAIAVAALENHASLQMFLETSSSLLLVCCCH